LIVFVFPAKAPYTKTAWDLLSFVKDEWKRKVIFVLQQADLEPDHLAIQKESVRSFALQRGVSSPLVFATSAKWESEGKQGIAGFEDMRTFIRNKVTGGKHLYEKLESQIAAAAAICALAEKFLDSARTRLESDTALQRRIEGRLGCGTDRCSKEIEALANRLVEKYESIATEFKAEFREGLNISAVFKMLLPGTKSAKHWVNDIQKRFEEKLNKKLGQITVQEAELFSRDLKCLLKEILNDLETISKPGETFGTIERMENRRANAVESVKSKLTDLTQNLDDLTKGLADPTGTIPQGVVIGTGLALIGAIIMKCTALAILDITGGTLTAIGLSVAGFMLLWRRRQVIQEFEMGLERGKEEFHSEIKEKLSSEFRGIYNEVRNAFQPFFDDITLRQKELEPQLAKLETITMELASLGCRARS
jgi:hypothetical protein